MGSDLPLWFILPITNIIIGKGTSKKVRVLRNIETKFIKAVKTSLNVVGIVFPGKFRRYVKANIWSKHRHGKRKRHIPLKLPCSRDWAKNKNKNTYFSGKCTRFWINNQKKNCWYNLVAILKHVLNISHEKVTPTLINGFYGSPITDVTNYKKVGFQFGLINVVLDGERLLLSKHYCQWYKEFISTDNSESVEKQS